MDKKIAIVTPSYREFKNIPVLIKKIRKILPESEIVIVDDSPKNENSKLNVSLKGKNVKAMSRFKKLGRGSAVLAGLKEAFKNKTIEYFFEMDSDLAHDPKEIPRFVKKIGAGNFDLIVGSRNLPGGGTINIPKNRIVLSKIINKFLYFWLGVKLTDYTGGFRLYSRASVEFLLKAQLKSTGFITLSEVAYKLNRNGFKIAEVPITIHNRIHGKSNVDAKEFVNSLFFVLKMRLKDVLGKRSQRRDVNKRVDFGKIV